MAARVVVLREGRIRQYAEAKSAETEGDPEQRGAIVWMIGFRDRRQDTGRPQASFADRKAQRFTASPIDLT